MLHRDSRFWDVIAKRNEAHAKDEEANADPMYGLTVGRRRDFASKKKSDVTEKAQSPALQTFSIGNEFDFLPSDDPKPAPKPAAKPKPDSLMEALMGALNEEPDNPHETETIVFEASGDDTQPKPQSAPASMGVPSLDNAAAAGSGAEGKAAGETPVVVSGTASAAGSDDKTGDDDMDALLADANMNLGADMDALLADVGDGDDDLLDLDADLEDLENFLSQK